MMTDELNKENEARYCKKGGAEIPGTDKSKLCIKKKKKRGERIRNVALTIAAVAGSAFLGKEFIKNPSDDTFDNVDGTSDNMD